jgi:hypothetical protein
MRQILSELLLLMFRRCELVYSWACSFAYASDIAENRGGSPGRIVELPF